MTRKDSEKDSERPHYYSQFWLDIAAGRRTIGSTKAEEGEGPETGITEPVPQRKTLRPSEPEVAHATHLTTGRKEEVTFPNSNDAPGNLDENPVDEDDNNDYQDSVPLEDDDIPDMDLNIDEEEEENADENLMDEEEEDDDINWGGGRSRKKTKPIRSVKTPLKKSGKIRRSF
jgi:hypothetical protein